MMKIVEFFGGPGSGKTTMATRIFSEFKQLGIDCEFTREYAQEAIYAGQRHHLDSQLIIAANQYRKYKELEQAGTRLVFSDTSMLLTRIYGREQAGNDLLSGYLSFRQREFDITSVFVQRVKPFRQQGRVQDEKESKQIDLLIKTKLAPFDFTVPGNEVGITELLNALVLKLGLGFHAS